MTSSSSLRLFVIASAWITLFFVVGFANPSEQRDVTEAERLFRLGMDLTYGNGVEQDLEKALPVIRKAADLGHVGAAYQLGIFRFHGVGTENRDLVKGVNLVSKALQVKDEKSRRQVSVAVIGMTNIDAIDEQFVMALREDLEKNDVGAMALMGACLAIGQGVKRDYAEAVKWLHKAINSKKPDVITAVGVLFCACVVLAEEGRPSGERSAVGPDDDPAERIFRIAMTLVRDHGGTQLAGITTGLFSKASELGHAGARYRLGVSYYFGLGTGPADIIKGINLITESLKMNDEKSKRRIVAAITGTDLEVDEKLFKSKLKAAEKGEREARILMAACHATGLCTARDFEAAVKWLPDKKDEEGADKSKSLTPLGGACAILAAVELGEAEFRKIQESAEKGDVEAQVKLAAHYANKDFKDADDALAAKWYRKAAEQGHAEAQLMIGYYYDCGIGVKKDCAEAMKFFRKSAEQGNDYASYDLGLMLFYGQGVATNRAEGAQWLRKAADQGLALAQDHLGNLYYRGIYFEKNFPEAVKWFQKSAQQNNANSSYNLAIMNWNGYGIATNRDEGVRWFRKAAALGNVEAQIHLACCYLNGENVEKDDEKGVEILKEIAGQGNAEAQYFLGACYFEGRGIEKDEQIAKTWLLKAKEGGEERAANFLEKKFKAAQ